MEISSLPSAGDGAGGERLCPSGGCGSYLTPSYSTFVYSGFDSYGYGSWPGLGLYYGGLGAAARMERTARLMPIRMALLLLSSAADQTEVVAALRLEQPGGPLNGPHSLGTNGHFHESEERVELLALNCGADVVYGELESPRLEQQRHRHASVAWR